MYGLHYRDTVTRVIGFTARVRAGVCSVNEFKVEFALVTHPRALWKRHDMVFPAKKVVKCLTSTSRSDAVNR